MLTESLMKKYGYFLLISDADRGGMQRYDYFLPLLAIQDAYRRHEETT
jgi:hypothetical protein